MIIAWPSLLAVTTPLPSTVAIFLSLVSQMFIFASVSSYIFDREKGKGFGLKVDEKNINYQSIDGFKPSKYGLYESACTLNKSWGFSYRDHNWISPEKLANNRKHLNSLGINYLVNVGPDHLGRIPGPSVTILQEAAKL